MEAPTGIVTFLFTDIEGSTARWEADRVGMEAALAQHDAVLRTAIEAQGGYLFKHTGDGVCAAFASPGAAIDAAIGAQLGLELPVRMGIATGEATPRDGDYFGPVLNQTARVMEAGHGGQILLAAATAALVSDAGLVDLGLHRLKDLSVPLRLFQVSSDGLLGRFPPLRTLDVSPGNLRPQATSFVGRDRELAEVADRVRANRLVTLTGPGGVGKTRLALQVAAALAGDFADGAWVCELAGAANDEEMMQVAARVLGVGARPQMTMTDSIVDSLRARQLLIVLDNCEHLVDDVARLAEAIVGGAPRVSILATSQESLGITPEREWRLRSLSLTREGAGASGDAVELFIERAVVAAPELELRGAVEAISEICRRLDGIPLAIELAAARVKTMTPAEIAAHLDERFRLLVRGPRDLLKRHQTMIETVRWSYSLLSGPEVAVFNELGVFPASFDEAAAVAVCAHDDVERWDVIDALAGLVGKSLLEVELRDGSTRYTLLETMRQFARERVAEDGDPTALKRRHASHYAKFAEEAGAALTSPDELTWRPRVDVELDNLRAVIGWAFHSPDPDDVELGGRIIAGLVMEAGLNPTAQVQRWTSAALERLDEMRAPTRTAVLAAASFDAFYAGDMGRAQAFGRRVIEAEDSPVQPLLVASTTLSITTMAGGDPGRAIDILRAGEQRVTSTTPDDWASGNFACVIGFIANTVGDTGTGAAEAERAVTLARRAGTPSLLALALGMWASALRSHHPAEALAAAEESIALSEAGAGDAGYAMSLYIAAELRYELGDIVGSAVAVIKSIGRSKQLGARNLDVINMAILPLSADAANAEVIVTLAGALDGPLHNTLPFSMQPSEPDRPERIIGAVGATLPTGVAEAARQRGESMSYDELIDYTLEGLRSAAAM